MSDLTRTFTPTAKQVRFCRMNKKHNGYGGARGGGKSWVVRFKAALLCNRFAGIKVCIVRRTLVDVRNNHIIPLKQMLHGLAKYNQTDRTFYFPNGSTIHFEYYDSENDDTHFQGNEWDTIFIEESTQLPEEWIKNIAASCRGANDFPHRIYYTCNPGGPGHQYIKRIFIDRIYKDNEDPDEYDFVQAKVTDNKVLMEMDPGYIQFLKNLPPKKRAAWLDGSWDIYSGQFFESFVNDPDHYEDRKWTHVIAPFTPRKHWTVYRSFDWGSFRPFSVSWNFVDEDDVIYRAIEFYGVQHADGEALANEGLKWPAEKVFAEIARIEREHPWLAGKQIIGIADPAIFQQDGGPSIAEAGYAHGIYFQKADNSRIPGWDQVRYRMQFNEQGYPRLYIFNTCKDAIRTLPLLQHDEHIVDDCDSSGEDHIADELRYLCQARPVKPLIETPEYRPAYGSDPLNMFGGKV